MLILAVETSCDETAAAVTDGLKILSSVKHTQEVHQQYGGVVPSLAKRAHEERIERIIRSAMERAGVSPADLNAVAVTAGPGLAIALEVGIRWAKRLAVEWNKPLVAVNHIEGHILSAINDSVVFPAAALVVSGGHTQVIWVERPGKYQILAQSLDDDIGEALDKGARMLDLPYPGGPALEKLALKGDPGKIKLPLPMAGREGKAFSYSGLKTAFYRLTSDRKFTEAEKCDLAAAYQAMVFKHLIRTVKLVLQRRQSVKDLLIGGGVAANERLRALVADLGRGTGMRVHFPAEKILCTDNAAMIGVAAEYKVKSGEFTDPGTIDRVPRARVDEPWPWEANNA